MLLPPSRLCGVSLDTSCPLQFQLLNRDAGVSPACQDIHVIDVVLRPVFRNHCCTQPAPLKAVRNHEYAIKRHEAPTHVLLW